MAPALPLPTLLSQLLVAYTIEIDNEAEHRLPHRTSRGDQPAASHRRDAPWLVSFALWANVLQYVEDEGVTVADLRGRARTSRLLLGGMRRWGYVSLHPAGGEALRNPPADNVVVRPTAAGRRAGAVWSTVPAVVDVRWRDRFGAAELDALSGALRTLFVRLPVDPPAFLPVVYPTQNGKAEPLPPSSSGAGALPAQLSALLSGVLVAFALDAERVSRISLPIGANSLRVLQMSGVNLRDLPRLTGVSKEATAMGAGWLERHDCVVAEPDPTTGRGKVLRLTTKGESARRAFRRAVAATEESWRATFGSAAVDDVRAACAHLVGDGTLAASPLARCLEPYPDNWRARRRPGPDTLPHYPMVLHRGGYPDGS